MSEHKKILEELIKEHAQGRSNLKKLAAAKEKYTAGDNSVLTEIINNETSEKVCFLAEKGTVPERGLSLFISIKEFFRGLK